MTTVYIAGQEPPADRYIAELEAEIERLRGALLAIRDAKGRWDIEDYDAVWCPPDLRGMALAALAEF